ncbi:MAG: sugar transferase [Lachnospiraceae bacterium]|nr:sugar transferase [Lachnospiraceae bacterium]
MYRHFFKRVLDIIISFTALWFLWPVLLAVAILVRIKLGAPVLFSQERPGKDEKIFRMYKFRTMTDERDEKGDLLPDEKRLTPFGKFLRSTSLDELPELWAIFTGKMSLVGPRPLLVQYLPLYNAEQHRRHEVRPGLTGWAQVNGRNCVGWQERFKLDVEYVDKMSLWMDIKIIFLTIKTVLVREGISSETSATMEYFLGNDE